MGTRRRWCRTGVSKYGTFHYELLVSKSEFNKAVEWFVEWTIHNIRPTLGLVKEKWYKMRDGVMIQISAISYSDDSLSASMDSWCREFPYEVGVEKMLKLLEMDMKHKPTVYVGGNVPDEVLRVLPNRVVRLPLEQ